MIVLILELLGSGWIYSSLAEPAFSMKPTKQKL